MSRPLEDYALIGDGETAALVARNGSIDWLCWPRFDSDACFAALLGSEAHGCWQLAPQGVVVNTTRRYQRDTLIVETDFETESGSVRLIDFMPQRRATSSVVRIVAGLTGRVAMQSELRLRFDYGSLPPWCEKTQDGATFRVGPDVVVLQAPVPQRLEGECQSAAFEVKAGQRLAFVLSHSLQHPPTAPVDPEQALTATQSYWRDWIGCFDDAKTEWAEPVRRSLITLRAMIYEPSGGLVAAPTTSLPEAPGGQMNWDYRYCWLRDATFTMGALLNAGFHTEAGRWRDWLLRAIAGNPDRMRIMYRVDGSRHLSEWQADTLPGYRYSSPVRIGNAASTQHQIDVYGEVLDCLSLARKGGIPVSAQEAVTQLKLLEHLETLWNTPGSGVWESRAEPRQYTYSKVMAWVGVDRMLRYLKSEQPRVKVARLEHLEALKSTIHAQVCREGWNPGLGTFTEYYGGHEVDASLLLMPLVGFLPANDSRMHRTVETIRRELMQGGLVRRKKARPGKPAEGAFIACSCWMADCLMLEGRTEDAREQFERVLALRNDVGLFSEEYDVPGQCLAGNFPQALTHLAVVNTALSLSGPTLTRGGP